MRAFATLSTFCLLDSTLLCHPRKSQTTAMNLKSCGEVGSPGSILIPGTCWVAKECSHRTGVLSRILKLRITTWQGENGLGTMSRRITDMPPTSRWETEGKCGQKRKLRGGCHRGRPKSAGDHRTRASPSLKRHSWTCSAHCSSRHRP